MKIRILLISLIVALSVAFQGMLNTQYAMAQTNSSKDAVCEGISGISGGACTAAEANRVTDTVKVAIRIFQIIAGVVAIFMMIIAGLRFITSSGSSDGVKSARNTILYAAIGIIIVIISEAIIRFVLNRFS